MLNLVTRPWFGQVMAPIVVGLVILVVWQSACTYFEVPRYLFPTPSATVSSFLEGWPLLRHGLWSTLKVTVLAFAVSVILETAVAFCSCKPAD